MKKTIIIFSLLVTSILIAQSKKYIQYTVKDNETITSISKKFGVTPYDILKLNPDAQDGINIDQILILPNSSFTSTNKVTNLVPSNNISVSSPKYNFTFKDSIVNGYVYHRVKAGETVYSLSKKYKYKKKKVLKLNKLNKRASLSIGQLLKFPTNLPDTVIKTKPVIVKSEEIKIDTNINEFDSDFVNYEVKAQETLYSIAKNNNLTQQQILDINPSIKVNGLREYDIIKLPVVKENAIVENLETKTTNKFTYVIPAKETFYNLQRKYNISKAQLLELNPILKEGLKEGLEIKIPVIENKNTLNRVYNLENKTLNLTLLLPFNADTKQEISFDMDKRLDACTDFYLGTKLALADLKEAGLSVNVNVLDTKEDVNVVRQLAQSSQVNNADVIIGPFSSKNVMEIAKNKLLKVPIISPFTKKENSFFENKNVVQTSIFNKDKIFKDAMVTYIKKNVTKEKIIIVTEDNPETILLKNNIKNSLLQHDSINKVEEYILTKGRLDIDKLKEITSKKEKNWVIVLAKNDIYLESFIETFGVFDKSYDLTLFGVRRSKNHARLKNIYLSRVNYHYPTINFTDRQLPKTKEFINKYVAVYKNQPSNNVLKGYDVTYDALIRLALNNSRGSFNENIYEGLNTVFSYSNTYNGISNKGVQIVQYNNFSIEKVK